MPAVLFKRSRNRFFLGLMLSTAAGFFNESVVDCQVCHV